MVSTSCGIVGANARPNWKERSAQKAWPAHRCNRTPRGLHHRRRDRVDLDDCAAVIAARFLLAQAHAGQGGNRVADRTGNQRRHREYRRHLPTNLPETRERYYVSSRNRRTPGAIGFLILSQALLGPER
jgi:hypothetical protein